MYYIVGLGNPGKEYEDTRHNIGWMVLDWLVAGAGLPAPVASSKYAGRVSEGVLDSEEITLLYPETFMNKSGSAVKKLVSASDAGRLIVVYDDVDLALGELKVSFGRGDGGHNGIKSIVAELGTKDFVRIRVGISPKSFWTGKVKRPAAERLGRHVLGIFSSGEQKVVADVLGTASEAIRLIVVSGVEKAMNQYN